VICEKTGLIDEADRFTGIEGIEDGTTRDANEVAELADEAGSTTTTGGEDETTTTGRGRRSTEKDSGAETGEACFSGCVNLQCAPGQALPDTKLRHTSKLFRTTGRAEAGGCRGSMY